MTGPSVATSAPRRSSGVVAPLALGLLVLVVWHLVVVAFAVPAFLLPTPLAIAQQFVAQFPVILSTAAVTGGNALVGLIAGFLIGLVLAVLAASSRLIAELTTPVVLAASEVIRSPCTGATARGLRAALTNTGTITTTVTTS